MTEKLNLASKPADFDMTYEYMIPAGPRYVYNRYTAFLCMYSHMLEDVKRQYGIPKNDILEDNETAKAAAIAQQLSIKSDELKKTLLESVNGTAGNSSDIGKPGQGDAGQKKRTAF